VLLKEQNQRNMHLFLTLKRWSWTRSFGKLDPVPQFRPLSVAKAKNGEEQSEKEKVSSANKES
jgi:hypothetical protein